VSRSKKALPISGKVFLTERTVSDLLEIESYSIQTWGKVAAKRYLSKFEKAIKLIETNPDLLRPEPLLHKSLLFYRVEKHLIAGVKIEAGIAVLTIAHASRDLLTLFHELSPTLKQETTFLLRRFGGGPK
jgi:plasmid stabilization system protein ParE